MPDNELVFDVNRCPVDPVQRIPHDNILVDTRVPDAPPDIPDCPDAPLPMLPPEQCPTFTPSSGTSKMTAGSKSTGTFSYNIKKSNCCDFEFEFSSESPCPVLNPPIQNKVMPFTDAPNQIRLFVKKKEPGCEYEFDVGGDIHCPDLSPALISKDVIIGATPQGNISLSITKVNDCDYEFDIDLTIPCPSISAVDGESTVTMLSPTADPYVNVTVVKTGDCIYEFTFDFGIPRGTGSGGSASLQVDGYDVDTAPVTVNPTTDLSFEAFTLPLIDLGGGHVSVASKQPARRLTLSGYETEIVRRCLVFKESDADDVANRFARFVVTDNEAGDEVIVQIFSETGFTDSTTVGGGVNIVGADIANGLVESLETLAVANGGSTHTIPLERITLITGSQGSATFERGLLVAYTDPT